MAASQLFKYWRREHMEAMLSRGAAGIRPGANRGDTVRTTDEAEGILRDPPGNLVIWDRPELDGASFGERRG